MALRLDPDNKPHRIASNSCANIQRDLVECYKASKCYTTLTKSFHECLNNLDPKVVGTECLVLKRALTQCRRNLLNGKFRQTGNPYSG